MSTHASDVAHAIAEALRALPWVADVTGPVTEEPNPEEGFPNRDGLIAFSVLPTDHMRSHMVTVRARPLEDHYLRVAYDDEVPT